MLQILRTLRDFLTEEELKFLPGRLEANTFILLKQHKTVKGDDDITRFERPIQVFTSGGTYIGEITNPEYIPDKND